MPRAGPEGAHRRETRPIDLWLFRLDCEPALLAQAEDVLGEEEKRRATKFRFRRHRRRFVVRRAFRRVLLGALADDDPSDLRFVESPFGKPRLAVARAGLAFSTSHSGEWGIIATHAKSVGVDIEILDRPVDHLRFAEHHFTEEEFREIRRHRDEGLRRAFFNCWTGKEAYVKALGQGLQKPLKSFGVECGPDRGPGLLFDSEAPQADENWIFERYSSGDTVATVIAAAAAGRPTLHFLGTDTIRKRVPVEQPPPAPWQES